MINLPPENKSALKRRREGFMKVMRMTYREMAEEYRQSAEQIAQKIKRLKAERKTASVFDQVSIDKRIWILYGMYFD